MSTSGSRERISAAIHRPVMALPTAMPPSVLAEIQPHDEVWLTETRMITKPSDMSAAEVQLTRPGVLTGDSGTKKCVAAVAATIATSGSQKSQW